MEVVIINDLIVKHNEIIEGRYNFTLTEAKIIAKLTSLIKKGDDEFEVYKFSAQQLLKDLKMDKNNYKDLKVSIEKLMTRIITIKTNNSILKTTFLSSAEYFTDSTIELSFDKKLKPYLLQLGTHFTKYHLENILNLKSFYAIRIYELLKQYEKIGERIISIQDLKIFLNIENKYKRLSQLKEKVILISEREINKKTDINISFEEIKTGRKVTSLKFIISKKYTIEYNENEFSEETRSLFALLPSSEQIETHKIKLNALLKKHSFEILKNDIEFCKKNYNKNFWAYFMKSIKEGHYSIENIEKLEKKQEVKQEQISEIEKDIKTEQEERNKVLDKTKLYQNYYNYFNELDREKMLKIANKAKDLMIQAGFEEKNKKILKSNFENVYCYKAMIELGFILENPSVEDEVF